MIQYQKNPYGIHQTRQAANVQKPFRGIDPNLKPEPTGFVQKFFTILKAWGSKK